MASPCWAKVRTNWCSFTAAYTLSDCAYAALFFSYISPQTAACFSRAHFHHATVTTWGHRGSISVLYYWLLSDRPGVDMLISITIDPASVWLLDDSLFLAGLVLQPTPSLSCIYICSSQCLFLIRTEHFTSTRNSTLLSMLLSLLLFCSLIQEHEL